MPDAVAGHARAAMMSASTIEHSRRPGDEGDPCAAAGMAPAGTHRAAVPPKLSPPLLTEREPRCRHTCTPSRRSAPLGIGDKLARQPVPIDRYGWLTTIMRGNMSRPKRSVSGGAALPGPRRG
jgi:hypothetical protein